MNTRLERLRLPTFNQREYRVPHRRFSVTTLDGVTIRGVHLQRGSDLVCIYCHGFMSHKTLKAIPGFVEALAERFDAVAFDFRGHGESTGVCTFTEREILDLDAVVRYLRAQGYRRIVLIGSSMGGATVIRYAALYGGVEGVVTIGAFADFTRFHYPMTRLALEMSFNHPWGPTYTRLVRNTRLGQLKPVPTQPLDLVDRITAPILFIHGEWDMLVPPNEARLLHDHAIPPKEIVVLPRTGHDMPILNRKTRDLIGNWVDRTLMGQSDDS